MIPPISEARRRLPREVVGLIPAAGHAHRVAPLPCSKELYPIGFRASGADGCRPKVAGHYLLEKMRLAGAARAYIVLRKGKWDIPSYFGDGSLVGFPLAYLMVGLPWGVPYTLDQAYPFVRDALVAFGFADVLFEPNDAYVRLLRRLRRSRADVVLGIFPADCPERLDMVDRDAAGRVRQITINPGRTRLRHAWAIAVWTPAFTDFLHEYLATRRDRTAVPELSVGHLFQAAVERGLQVEADCVSNLPFLDIGTPEDLRAAVRRFVAEQTEPAAAAAGGLRGPRGR